MAACLCQGHPGWPHKGQNRTHGRADRIDAAQRWRGRGVPPPAWSVWAAGCQPSGRAVRDEVPSARQLEQLQVAPAAPLLFTSCQLLQVFLLNTEPLIRAVWIWSLLAIRKVFWKAHSCTSVLIKVILLVNPFTETFRSNEKTLHLAAWLCSLCINLLICRGVVARRRSQMWNVRRSAVCLQRELSWTLRLSSFLPPGNFKGMCKQIDHFPEETDYEADPSEYFLREYTPRSKKKKKSHHMNHFCLTVSLCEFCPTFCSECSELPVADAGCVSAPSLPALPSSSSVFAARLCVT